MSRSPIQIGIIGCGFIGSLHAHNVVQLPRVKLRAICDSSEDNVKRLSASLAASLSTNLSASVSAGIEGVYTTTDPEDVLSDPDIDMIIVATPVDTHVDYALAVHQAGKHLLLEKPVAPTLGQALALQQSIKELGSTKKTYVNLKFRYAPAFQQAVAHIERALVSSIQVAAPRVPDAHSMFHPGNGGYLLDCGVHAIDMILQVHPTDGPITVQAEAANRFHPRSDAFDTAVATLRFADGSFATFSLLDAAYSPFASKWMFQAFADGRSASVFHNMRRAKLTQGSAETMEPHLDRLTFDDVDELLLSLDAFVTSIINRQAPPIGLRDAIRAAAVVESIDKAARDRSAVTIDLSAYDSIDM